MRSVKTKKANKPAKQAKKPVKKIKSEPAEESKALAVVKQETTGSNVPATRSLADPSQVMEFGKILKDYITKNSLSTQIQGNDYAHVDGWKFAGMNFGLTAIPHKPVAKHEKGQYIIVLFIEKEMKTKEGKPYKKEQTLFVGYLDDTHTIEQVKAKYPISREIIMPLYSYECEVDIIRLSDGMKVGYGVGLCTNMEIKKATFEEYSVNSMSQTRAIGKAYRNLIGYVMNAAGFESTPAEEMEGADGWERETTPEPPPTPTKPYPSAGQMGNLMRRSLAGEDVLKSAQQYFTLNQAQIEAIKVAYEQSKTNPNG